MQSIRSVSLRYLAVFGFGCAALGMGQGCGVFGGGSEQKMASSSAIPAGKGTVEATEGESGNTKLEVQVEHLAEPSRIAPEASTYVVWIEPRNGQIQNVGALQVDEDLVGRLETTTPHREFELSIMPEPSPRVSSPSNEPVFTSQVARSD